ncbi:MAG: SDR family oxidoreductase [Variibacter sp.]
MANETRVAFINAAAQGIGKATALRLADDGVALFLMDIDGRRLAGTAKEIEARGAAVEAHVGDATKAGDVEAGVAKAMHRFARIDALACIAGGAGGVPMHQVDEIALESWEKVLALNLTSTFLACRHIVPIMRTRQYGRIVCLSSTVAKGRLGPVGTMGARLPYATAKAGLLGFTKQLAKDVGTFGITVNAVLPWLTFGEPGSKVRTSFENQSAEYRDKTLAMSPQRRPVAAQGVAAAISFFLSEDAGYVSGTALPVDGGVLT